IGAVVITSGKERVFCAGANIRMLSQSPHGFKVNFCKFTNETRNAIEDATVESRQVYLTAINGPCAGGGYELALATDWIIMADERSGAPAGAARADRRARRDPLRPRRVRPRPHARDRPHHGGRARRVTAGRRAGRPRPGLVVLAARPRAGARRSRPPPAHQRSGGWGLGVPDRGTGRARRGLRPVARGPPGRLARA